MSAKTVTAFWILLLSGTAIAKDYAVRLNSFSARHQEFVLRWTQAVTPADREAVREEAKSFVVRTLVDEVFPAWTGTPWYMGEDDDAIVPHQEGKRVSCSAFVTAALMNIGLRLDSRVRWMQAPALHIQRSLAPEKRDLYRYFSVDASAFARVLAGLDAGLYVIGLNCHVGFIWIRDRQAWFIHSNYVDPDQGVTREPVAGSQAIAKPERVGYWVTPLFRDDRLIEFWLEDRIVPLQALGGRVR